MWAGGRIRRGAFVVTAAAVLLASSCTDDDATDGDPPERQSTTIPTSPVDGGAVRLGIGGPLVVDPVDANPGSPTELMVLDLLHDGLTRLGDDSAIEPALATGWEHDEALTTWTFQLDPDATFSDGSAVTADTVVASIERMAATGAASLASIRLEAIVGYAELQAGTAETLVGVTAGEGGTVEIQTTEPLSTLPAILAAPEMGIVAGADVEGLVDDGDLAELPLSGSWEVAEADGEVVALSRRSGSPGHLDAVDLHRYDDAEAAYDAFEEGDVDWAAVPGSLHDDAVEAYGDDHFAPFHAEVFLGLRATTAPLDNADLRVAIAAAIDRSAIVETVYADVADPLGTIVPVGVPGHDPQVCQSEACSYSRTVAEASLARAFPDGDVPTVAIDFDDSDRQTELAELVAGDLEAAGIPTELRPRGRDEYRAFVTSGDQRLFSLGWIGGYPSPDAYLAPLLSSAADDNLTGVASPPVDAALAAARATDSEAEAAEQWTGAERRVLRAAVVIPIAQFRTQVVVADRVQDLLHRIDGTVDWSAVWVADAGGR